MTVLVVGANGQLGARCCLELISRAVPVRGSVRVLSRGAALAAAGVDLVEADLTSEQGLTSALAGVECVVVTANAAAPRARDRPGAVDDGLRRLLDDAATAGVARVVLVSVAEGPDDGSMPLPRARRELERRVRDGPYDHVIVRFPPFMECWLALVGSSLPLRGESLATIGRPSPFLRAFRRITGSLVEDHGVMLVPGPAGNRNAFIAERDVAAACAEAVVRPEAAGTTYEVGGPEVLSWRDVADAFERVLHRRVRVVSTPVPVYRAAATLLAPFAKVPAATMALNRFVGSSETPWPAGAGLLDVETMMTVHDFLADKAQLPPELPTVP